jgi:nicotinamide phosphoribosyltransferase
MRPLHNTDFYKTGHIFQYDEKTETVFANWTPRGSRMPGVDKVTFFGLQHYIKKHLIEAWQRDFFDRPKHAVLNRYRRRLQGAGLDIDTKHIEALHTLGYLPIQIRALPEGSRVPVGVPMFVMWNTSPEFFWLTNYLETSLSCELWGMCTSATIAGEYRRILDENAKITGGDVGFVDWQGHDFSMRGMYGVEAAAMSGAAHLLHFTGTDTIPAIDLLEDYYGGVGLIGGSVPATEHSVMCTGTKGAELETIRRLITETYPSGPISIVCDTWDYWKVITEYLPALKEEIMAREGGPVVVRPDSGDPVKILCGDPSAPIGSPERLGTFELLMSTFGCAITSEGYLVLDPHVSAIYGDAITRDRAREICARLRLKGIHFSGVLGIGSYTYQMNTRDTFGFALKSTYVEVAGEGREIFKDPKTDKGDKKSAKGLLAVYMNPRTDEYELRQGVTWKDVRSCAFELVFDDGELCRDETLADIRGRA